METYKDVPVIFQDLSEYTIEEVLTDPILFNDYKNVYNHYVEKNLDTDTTVLYVSLEDQESAEKMITTINNNESTRSSKKY